MYQIVDFSTCTRVFRSYGGSDRKISVLYDGSVYMLKFQESHEKKSDISSSYVNNVTAEFISSHISKSIGLPTHDTILGMYKGDIVVACKDFREKNQSEIEFSELIHSVYDSKDIKRIPMLSQIYSSISDPINALPDNIQKASIKRYWDMFVVDALVGNFDRHMGNWSYLTDGKDIELSPIYDYGSTLFPQLSDEGAKEFLQDDFRLLERCFVFPSADLCLTREKNGKVGYYDMLNSGFDENCSKAVLRIVPKIDLSIIDRIIDDSPFVSENKKLFYKKIIGLRKELLLDIAYQRCKNKDYDKEALFRVENEQQYTSSLLRQNMENGSVCMNSEDILPVPLEQEEDGIELE